MSKRLIAVIVILLLLIGVCIWEQISVDTYLDDIYNKTLAIQNYTKETPDVNQPEVLAMVKDLEKSWKHHEEMLCFVVNHNDLDDLAVEITRLKSYSQTNERENFRDSLNVIIYFTGSYHHIMGISLQNIL